MKAERTGSCTLRRLGIQLESTSYKDWLNFAVASFADAMLSVPDTECQLECARSTLSGTLGGGGDSPVKLMTSSAPDMLPSFS